MKRYFTVTVDTEEEWDWSSGYPTGATKVSNIRELIHFHACCQRYGVPVTYFTNHAVLSDQPAAAVISELHATAMAEVGLHIHPWNTPPLAQSPTVPVRDSFLHNLPQELAFAKLNTVYASFERCGLPIPTSYRGGRYATSPWLQAYLAERGCRADASILPYTTWKDDGAPDFRNRNPLPVRRTPLGTNQGLWEIPLTLAFTRRPWRFWQKFYDLNDRRWVRSLRLIGICERLLVNRVWLNLEHPLGANSIRLLPILTQSKLPCINLTLHSSSLMPGLSPYARTPADVEQLFKRLDTLLQALTQKYGFVPATITQVADSLERSLVQ